MMKQFGTVTMFDEAKGYGSIQPEGGGDELRFESKSLNSNQTASPTVNQRLSYEFGEDAEGKLCPVNLHAA